MSAVKVSKEAYAKFTSMTLAERAALSGSGASVLGLRMPDDVLCLDKGIKSRAERRGAELCVDGSHAQ